MKLNMFFLDWIVVPVWCSVFALGGEAGMLIMAPVTLIFAILNHMYAKKTVRLVLVDVNLMLATIAGIVISTMLFLRFIYADKSIVNGMVVEIFSALFYLTFLMIISMIVKETGRSRRRRIINKLAYEPDDDEDDEEDEDGDYYDDDDDDDDDLFDEEQESVEKRMADRLRRQEREKEEEEEDDDDEADGKSRDNSREPKFKVVKKK